MSGWSATTRAEHLGRRRPQLLAELPREIAASRSLSEHAREDIVDDAIVYTAFEHTKPVADVDGLEGVFWAACSTRIKRAHEGRFDTVRGRFARADDSELEQLTGTEDPASAVQARYELETLLEFARGLEPLERAVILKRHERPGAEKVHGYATIARELDQPASAVRSAMRSVERKLNAFSTVVADRQAFERKLAGVLPMPILAERAAKPTGLRETIVDWLSRPFGHDVVANAANFAPSGGGRGLGTVAVAICLGGTAIGGGYCVVTGTNPIPERTTERPQQRAAKPRSTAKPNPAAAAAVVTQGQVVADQAARDRRAEAQRAAQRRQERRNAARNQQRQENARAISPAAPNAAADGSSEFDPTFQPSTPPQPAAPADPGGLPEFP